MQFLIVTKRTSSRPPELLSLIGAMEAWVAQGRKDGTLKAFWAFAGSHDSGGILEVQSLEQLDTILASNPFGPFSSTEIYPLSDIARNLASVRAAVEQMGALTPDRTSSPPADRPTQRR